MKKMFLEHLSTKGKHISWKNSIGEKVKFIYEDVEGWIEIIGYIKNKNPKLKIRYNDKDFEIFTSTFSNCKIGRILGIITSEFKIEIGTKFKDDRRDITITDREYRKNKNNIDGNTWCL